MNTASQTAVPIAASAGLARRGSASSDRTLSEVIATIYNAALDKAFWPQVLAASLAYVGGESALILSKNAAGAVVHHQYGFDPEYLRLYVEDYWRADPIAMLPFFAVDHLTSVRDYMPLDEFCDGRFYREWGRPQGWIDAASVVLERSATRYTTFLVARHETHGPVDDEMSRRMRLIAPHVRRAVQIGKLVDVGQAERTTFGDVLDGLGAGVFLLDAKGGLVHANIAGRAMLEAGDCLHSTRGRLAARDPGVERTLRTALAGVAKGDPEVREAAMTLPLVTRNGIPHVAHLLPLTSGTGPRAGIANTAVAALFVHRATIDHPSLPETVARYFKLTPTELRVLLGIVEVGGAPEVADALGIADNTVKTHLGRLYQKTGTRRQADLVKLVAGFATPLLS